MDVDSSSTSEAIPAIPRDCSGFTITQDNLTDALVSLNDGNGSSVKDLITYFLRAGPSWLTADDIADQLKLAFKKGVKGGKFATNFNNHTIQLNNEDDGMQSSKRARTRRSRVLKEAEDLLRTITLGRRRRRSRSGARKSKRSRSRGRGRRSRRGRSRKGRSKAKRSIKRRSRSRRSRARKSRSKSRKVGRKSRSKRRRSRSRGRKASRRALAFAKLLRR